MKKEELIKKIRIQKDAEEAHLLIGGKSIIGASVGLGKTYIAMNRFNDYYSKKKGFKGLFTGARTIYSVNFKSEIEKSKNTHLLSNVKFICNKSLNKHLTTKYDVIVIDECFTGETEILTEQGFVKFNKLDKNLKIAQWKEGKINFITPIRHIEKDYDGKLINFRLKDKVYLPVTPNHNQPILKNGKSDVIKFKNLKSQHRLPVTGIGVDNNTRLGKLERVMIALQADGSIHNVSKTRNTTIAVFSFSKERKIKRFLKIINESGLNYNEVKSSKPKNPNKKQPRRFMVTFHDSNITKNINDYFVFPMGSTKAKEIIEEMIHWNGYIQYNGNYYFSSTNKTACDFYQKVATLAGYSTNMSIQKDDRKKTYNDVYRLYISKTKKQISVRRDATKEYIDYKGKVYCVEVPDHKIIIRHQGVVIVTGNCHKEPEMTLGFLKNYLQIYPTTEILGLTGTPLDPKSDIGKEYYKILPISYRKLLDNAIDDKILNDYSINVIFHELDNTNKNVEVKLKNRKSFYQTELQRYLYLSDKYEDFKNRKGWKDGKFPYELVQLKSLFKNSETKKKLVYSLLPDISYKKVLIYAGTIAQCESMKFPYYHSQISKKKKEETYAGFLNGDFNEMTNVGMLKESVSINNLDTGIIMCVDASSKAFTQSLGRLQRLAIKSKSTMYVLCAKGTIEETWLIKATSLLDFTKINYFSDINEFKRQK
jgi:hypothetical protein